MSAGWVFDEFKQRGLDFCDPQQVATYDEQQNSGISTQQTLVQRLGIEPGDVVVEIGTGTGVFAMAAAMNGAQVYAVDVSRAMLDYASRKSAQAGLTDIQFMHSGFLSYRHEGAPADFVVSQFALHHLPDFWKGVALKNIFDMLRPGGCFYLHDVVFSFDPADFERDIGVWIDFVSESGGFSREDFEMHVREEYSTYGWILEGLLTQAGFRVRPHYDSSTYGEYICIKPE